MAIYPGCKQKIDSKTPLDAPKFVDVNPTEFRRMAINDNLDIKLHYDGHWRSVPRTNRLQYEGGHQKKMTVIVGQASLKQFGETIGSSMPWLKGCRLKLWYTVPETNPRDFLQILNNEEFIKVVEGGLSNSKMTEMFIEVDLKNRKNAKFFRQWKKKNTTSKKKNIGGSYQFLEYELSSDDDGNYPDDEDENYVLFEEEMDNGNADQEVPNNVISRLTNETLIDDKDNASDEADDCYSQDSYHSYESSEDEYYKSESADTVNLLSSRQLRSSDDTHYKIGMKFESINAFRISLQTYSVINNFNYNVIKSDRERYIAKCAIKECPWYIRVYRMGDDFTTFQVTKLIDIHICKGVNKCGNKHATAIWIAQVMLEDVRGNPLIKPKDIQGRLQDKFGVSVPYIRALRGKDKALEMIYGNVEKSYDLVDALKGELQSRMPGSHIEIKLEDDKAFQRMFISFKPCVDGFKEGCRPFLGLDACHLRSKYLGMLMGATGLDGDNGLVNVAFAIVENESSDTWFWFVQHLKIAFGGDMSEITIISDQEKGLQVALHELIPEVEHRVCMRHMWKNFKKKFQGDLFEGLVWKAARAFNGPSFYGAMRELRAVSVPAYDELMGIDKYKWSRYTFATNSKNHYITNNISESYNAWILEARYLPAVDLVDKIRIQEMEKRSKRWTLAQKWKSKLVPMAERYLKDLSLKLGSWKVRKSSDSRWEVDNGADRFTVDLNQRKCFCKRWQLTGLPCVHVGAVIGQLRGAVWEDFVDDFYTVKRYKLAYKIPVATLPSKNQWEMVDREYEIGPPHAKRPRGRPAKKRKRGKDELQGNEKGKGKAKRIVRCGRCGNTGHYKNSCKEPINQRSQQLSNDVAEPSQAVDSVTSTKTKKSKNARVSQDQVEAIASRQIETSEQRSVPKQHKYGKGKQRRQYFKPPRSSRHDVWSQPTQTSLHGATGVGDGGMGVSVDNVPIYSRQALAENQDIGARNVAATQGNHGVSASPQHGEVIQEVNINKVVYEGLSEDEINMIDYLYSFCVKK